MSDALTREQVEQELMRFTNHIIDHWDYSNRDSLSYPMEPKKRQKCEDSKAAILAHYDSLHASLEEQTKRAEKAEQQLFDEQSLHAATQLCLTAQTGSVERCALKVSDLVAQLNDSVPKAEHNKIVTETILSMDAERTEFEQQLTASEQRVRELERMLKYTDEIDESVMEKLQQQFTEAQATIARLVEENEMLVGGMAGWCNEERANGDGPCGACAICCKELRDERDQLQATVTAQGEEVGALIAETVKVLAACRLELWYCKDQLVSRGCTEGGSVKDALHESQALLDRLRGGA